MNPTRMNKHPRVVIAMSGGVDSSVAAAFLVSQGFEVVGLMMRLWSEESGQPENSCCAPDSVSAARRVAAKLDFPFYVIDARELFFNSVVKDFIAGYERGITPNPCVRCNRTIRWGFLLDKAKQMGIYKFATGHYARIKIDPIGDFRLLRAIDTKKDQSYVLHNLNKDQLSQTILPLGKYTKSNVRSLAREFNLLAAERPESQDLCFVGEGNYRDFLIRNKVDIQIPGPILDRNGILLGEHKGIAFYTIGQRKGLGISSAEPLYVLEKDLTRNALILGDSNSRAKLELQAHNINWISGKPPSKQFRAQIKIRYRSPDAPGTVHVLDNGSVLVNFDEHQNDITPGQAVVFYDKEICLGGGTISQ
jgi:tRNA-specific 2-thiouridylase